MKLILIAPLVSHATIGRVAALANTGIEIILIDVSSRKCNYDKKTYPINKIKKIYYLNIWEVDNFFSDKITIFERLKDILRSYSILSENKIVFNKVADILKNENPNFVFLFYGPVAIHFLRIVKKINLNIKTVLIPNLIPSTVVTGNVLVRIIKKSISNEFINYKNWINKSDKIFVSSNEMKSFILKKFNYEAISIHIIPDLHSRSFFVNKKKINFLKNKSNSIVFRCSRRWGGKLIILMTN